MDSREEWTDEPLGVYSVTSTMLVWFQFYCPTQSHFGSNSDMSLSRWMLLKYFTCWTFQSKEKQIQEIQEFDSSSEKLSSALWEEAAHRVSNRPQPNYIMISAYPWVKYERLFVQSGHLQDKMSQKKPFLETTEMRKRVLVIDSVYCLCY